VLQGGISVGKDIVVSEGFTVTERDMVYNEFSKQSVLPFGPATYDNDNWFQQRLDSSVSETL
jgi:hypothetical protein